MYAECHTKLMFCSVLLSLCVCMSLLKCMSCLFTGAAERHNTCIDVN